MKIFIQGRKDGYNVLYPKPTPTEFFQFASDMQRIDADNNARYYGKSLYSIAFNGNGCIFSKFIIGYDVQHSHLGNIGISVFIPSTQKLAGVDVKTLLDKLVNIYHTNYCPDFYINNNKQEDWLLFTSHANSFDTKLRNVSADDVENYQQGAKDAAFVLYASDTELQKYFDAPYQEEYRDFKQTLFLENNSQDLLNVVKHDADANLTGEIDLGKYKLEYDYKYTDGINIEVNVRGNKKRNRGEWISREKDEITIIYSKDYYKNKIVTGKLCEIDNRFLQIDEMNRKITIHHFSGLEPETKIIRFDIKDEAGNTIKNARVSAQNNYEPKNTTSNEIIFTGKEIGDNWQIHIEAGDKYKPSKMDITPQNESCIPIILKAQKIVEFHVIDIDNGNAIHNFTLEIDRREEQNNQTTFYGNDIKKSWNIRIIANGYSVEDKKIVPIDENNPIVIKLKKKPILGMQISPKQGNKKKYYLQIDESKGKRSYHGRPICEYALDYPDFKCDPQFGYKFIEWDRVDKEVKNDSGRYDGYFEAVFKKLWYHKYRKSLIIGGSVIVASVILYFVLFKGNKKQPQPQPNTVTAILNYVESDSLMLDKLNDYKDNWKQQKSHFITKSGEGVFGGHETVDSTKWKSDWQPTDESIEQAITKRTKIDKKQWFELNSDTLWSEGGFKF